eukprot:gene1684-11886_t
MSSSVDSLVSHGATRSSGLAQCLKDHPRAQPLRKGCWRQ